ncbi:MAG: shikimate dehydrogenase [Betaproteobacteria bacterium]
MTDRYAVIGNPVAHSRSPEIHAAFSLQTGDDIQYERLLAATDRFAETLRAFRDGGASGANVTVPFKLEAFALSTECTPRAQGGKSANTLVFNGDKIIGDNTDGVGLCRDIQQNLSRPLSGARILLVGAGGAARGVTTALLSCEPQSLVITNRTQSKADAFVKAHGAGKPLSAIGLESLSTRQFDVVINATSASLSADMPAIPATCFADNSLAYEMMYGKGKTPFLTLAATAGARTADGLGMLVEQAAEAFFVWRGVRPSTGPVIAQLRDIAT